MADQLTCTLNGTNVTVIRHDPVSFESRAAWHSVIGRNSIIAQAGPMLPQAGALVLDVPDNAFHTWLIDQLRDTSLAVFKRATASPVRLDGRIMVLSLVFSPFIAGGTSMHETATLRYQKVEDVP